MPTDKLFQKYSRKSIGQRKTESHDIFLKKMDGAGSTNSPVGKSKLTLSAPGQVLRIDAGLSPYIGEWTDTEVIHLLKRTSFGNRKSAVDHLVSLGSASAAIDYITDLTNKSVPAHPSATPLNHYQNIAANTVDSTTSYGEDWTKVNLPYPLGASDSLVNSHRLYGLQFWNWGVWLNDEHVIREKMVNFWYHFIPVEFISLRSSYYNAATMCSDYMTMFRNNALGNFRTIIAEVTKSAAMLHYLGNQNSTASAPNENYARELLELFTIGKNPQNYTEQDVQAAAKVLSGWRMNGGVRASYPWPIVFEPSRHNRSDKTFSSFFNHTTIQYKAGASGAEELDEMFDMLFQYQGIAIAKYICTRLYRFFVYYIVDEETESTIITPLANQLISENWEIKPVIKTLLKSQHFFDTANRGVMIKSPFDLLAGILNTFDVNTTDPNADIYTQYRYWQYFNDYSKKNLEQEVGNVPDVSGWKAYYQEPAFYQNWINANSIQKRDIIIDYLIRGSSGVGTFKFVIDGVKFLKQFENSIQLDPNKVLSVFIKYSLPLPLPQVNVTEIKTQTLLANQTNDNYWTTAWQNYLTNPNTTNTKVVNDRLKALLNALLRLAEFQLM